MTQQDILYILDLIDEWVSKLSENRLNEECRKSGANFFSYMKARGVNAAYMAKLITEATGYNPSKLWTVDDAALLRDAIFRYEGAIEIERHTDLNAKEATDHMWRKSRKWNQ